MIRNRYVQFWYARDEIFRNCLAFGQTSDENFYLKVAALCHFGSEGFSGDSDVDDNATEKILMTVTNIDLIGFFEKEIVVLKMVLVHFKIKFSGIKI